ALAIWWKGFADVELDGLVDRAIAHNHDLRIAAANLKEARALRRLTTFDLAPTVQGNAGYQNGLLSKSAALPGASRGNREFELYDASFDATWELDLFGRVRRSVQAANAQLGSVEATRLDVLVSVTAEVARNYFELRGLQNQLAVARRNPDVQAETFAGLGKSGADTWNFGPRITWAALDLGRVHARIKAADARTEASLAFYERTVLTALEETEGTLVDFGQEQSRQQFLQTSAEASQKAADLAHQRYEGGVTDFLSVLDAERTLLEAQDRLAASQTRTVTALVAVYKALG